MSDASQWRHTPTHCWLCGRLATGLATLTTPRLGEIRLCHGDYDADPTCYQRFAIISMETKWIDEVPSAIVDALLPDAEVIPFPQGRVKK